MASSPIPELSFIWKSRSNQVREEQVTKNYLFPWKSIGNSSLYLSRFWSFHYILSISIESEKIENKRNESHNLQVTTS